MDEVIEWITFYNHRRIHAALGYVSPMGWLHGTKPCTTGYTVATWLKKQNAQETKKIAREHGYWGG